MLSDPALPQVATLLGDGVEQVLAAALEPAAIEVLGARASHVRYDPGRKIVVRYATRVRERGAERVDTLVAVADRDGPPAGVAVLAGPDGHEVGVWRYPNDPRLPGLRTLVYPEGARPVLAQLGVPSGELDIRPLVYRPGQRAVLRIVAHGVELYAKLVRPDRAEQVHRAHAELSRHARVPRSLGWSREHGLVILEALPGDRLADRLGSGAPVPSPGALLELLEQIAPADLAGTSPGSRGHDHHLRLLHAIVPEARATLDELAGRATYDLPAEGTVHGDFYEGQVLVRGRQVVGLLDVDTARPGHVVEDLATLLAHLDALALVRPRAAGRIRAYRHGVGRLALERAGRGAVDAAVTGVLLGLATGPFRLQEQDWRARTATLLEAARRRRGAGSARPPRMSDLSPRRHDRLTSSRDSDGHKTTTTRRTA
jgi:hypothetical protein